MEPVVHGSTGWQQLRMADKKQDGNEDYEISSSQLGAEASIGASDTMKERKGENYVRTTTQRIGSKPKPKSKKRGPAPYKPPKQQWEIEKEKHEKIMAVRRAKRKTKNTKPGEPVKGPGGAVLKKMNSEDKEKMMIRMLIKKTNLSETAVWYFEFFSCFK